MTKQNFRIQLTPPAAVAPPCSRGDCLLRVAANCAAIGVIRVDVAVGSGQNESPEVAQPWRRECPPFRGLQRTFWNSSGRVRTSRFIAADSTETHRQSWRLHSPQNSHHLRVYGGSSTSTRWRPNSIRKLEQTEVGSGAIRLREKSPPLGRCYFSARILALSVSTTRRRRVTAG